MNKRALITDYVHPSLIDGLEARGYEVIYNRAITLDEVREVIHQYHGIVINSKAKMTKDMIDAAPQLEWIARLGSGLEIIDLEYAAQKNILVINTPEGNRNAVAEHAMGMLLALANNLRKGDREVKDFVWNREQNRGWELKGKTVGIIGLGNTGSKLAKKLSSWELELIAYDKYKDDWQEEMPFVERVATVEDLLKRADIISLHLPLTEETHHLVDASFLEKCKKGVVLINTSRGKVVDTAVLLQALQTEKVKGVCLDVFENEKVNTYTAEEKKMYETLFSFENVIVSPHVAGWTKESLLRITQVLLKKLESKKMI